MRGRPDSAALVLDLPALEPPAVAARVPDLERMTLQVLASVEVQGREGRMFANLVGLSRRDMVLETQRILDEHAAVTVMFFLPGTRERLTIPAVVHTLLAADEQRYLLLFPELDAATRGIVETYLGLRSQR